MLPNLIVIGAMKCGTSALHEYLALHPEVFMSREKELNFFIADRNWSNGVDWYASMFPVDVPIRGEASPDYTNYPTLPGVPARMHAVIPDARLIYMVRDPVDRIVSQYMHNRWTGLETRPFDVALSGADGVPLEQTRYIRRSKYFMQLSQYLESFPASRIMVIAQEDLHQRRQSTMQQVFRFLGIDEHFQSDGFSKRVHESNVKDAKNRLGLALARGRERGILRRLPRPVREPAARIVRALVSSTVKRPVVKPALRRQILDLLAEDIHQLETFTGRAFPEWRSEA